MTADTFTRIRSVLNLNSGPTRDDDLRALDALVGAVGAQALLIRALTMRLRNSGIALARLDETLGRKPLAALADALGRPAPSGPSLAEAEHAAGELADRLSRGADAAAILTAIARIVSVFV